MGLNDLDRATIVELERAKSRRFFLQAEEQRKNEVWDLAINRYYYACFHIVQALFISEGLSAKTHSGMLRTFAQNFILTERIDKQFGAFLSRLMQLRQGADYNCAYELKPIDIEMCVSQSPLFIDAVEKLIK